MIATLADLKRLIATGEERVIRNPDLAKSQGKEAIRRLNLTAALSIVRRAGRLSRTELIKELHLSRTTVFELVSQLADLGLVVEDEAPQIIGVGRPSFVVSASNQVGALVVNPESDAITVGLVTLGGQVLEKVRRVSRQPLDPVATADVAWELVGEIRKRVPSGFQIAGAGVAVPGQVARETGIVRLAPRLGWSEVDFGGLLAKRLAMPVVVENNARLVTLAEHRLGVARGYTDFVYVFAGSGGIGGGVVANDLIVSGKSGFAGEIGHIRLRQDANPDFGGLTGTLEALVKRDDLLDLFELADASDDELDDLIQGASPELLYPIAEAQLQSIGVALGNLANIFDPQLIVLGGFIGSLHTRFPDTLRVGMTGVVLPAIGRTLEIRSSADASGKVLLGAAESVFVQVVENPIDFQYVD
ncbi:MAG: family transcriptional regulator [Microbacteriaceae bacterium]|nr:family transcriptional regulator [Microbacteriaceae bacterium]